MRDPQGDNRTAKRSAADLGLYLSHEPVVIAILSIAAVVCFLLVGTLSRAYHAKQGTFAVQWAARGTADLRAQRYRQAVADFRSALLYSPDNSSYQFNLAEALLGEKRTDEAAAYLVSLWEREPDNGRVSLELARIAAGRGQPEQAIRYYHNAIYATWPADQPEGRQQTRLELIDYLLRIGEKPQAQSELIALAANVGDDPVKRAHVGDLFIRADDYVDALAAYTASLKARPKNQAALAGAGRAAFELRRYALARQYLREAAAVAPLDPDNAERLETADIVLRMDPFRRQIPVSERNRIVIAAFTAAGTRLAACAPDGGAAATTPDGQDLSAAWQQMKPKMTTRSLWRNPDLADGAMDLVFGIERRFSTTCAGPTPTDRALLLIARLHEGS